MEELDKATETAWKSEVEWRRVQLRTEALRAAAQVHAGAIEVDGIGFADVGRETLGTAAVFTHWLETGEQ